MANSAAGLMQGTIATLERQRLGFAATVTRDGRPDVSLKGTFTVAEPVIIASGTSAHLRNNSMAKYYGSLA